MARRSMMTPTEPLLHDSAGSSQARLLFLHCCLGLHFTCICCSSTVALGFTLLAFAETTVKQQEVESLEGVASSLQKARGHQPDAMEIVRDLQARIEVKKEAMEEEQHEHARRHAQLQSVVEENEGDYRAAGAPE